MPQPGKLGGSGPIISSIGLGCMGMSGTYGLADRDESIGTIHAALGAGVTLLDTGDFYGMGHNELLIAEALAGRPRDEVVISVKFGSLISRRIERAILPTCRELGVAITAYGVLSRGLISGHYRADGLRTAGDMRGRLPRFQGENLRHNLALVEELRAVAGDQGATVAQIAVAWVVSRGEDIVPLIGARRRDQLDEALGALELELSPEDLERIEQAVPPGAAEGDRYGAPQMADLDSERD